MYYNSARDHLSAEANSNRLQPSMPWSSGRVVRRVKEGATTLKARVRGPQLQPGSTDERLAGPTQHHGNSLVHFISISDKLPRLSMHVDEDPKSRLGSANYRLAGPCPQKKIIDFLIFRFVTGSRASQCMCRRIPISAWLGKFSAGGTMPAQSKIFDFLIFRLATGPQASECVCKRIRISVWFGNDYDDHYHC